MTSKRRYLFFALFIVLLAAAAYIVLGHQPGSPTCPNCNILLIDFDLLRADSLPCYGYRRNTAPNLCAVAGKSLLFTDNYAVANFTLPSMVSTVTSLYPAFHGVRTEFIDVLPPQIPTLAQTLKLAGYQTAVAGMLIDDDAYAISRQNGGLRGYDRVAPYNEPLPKVINELSKNNKPWFIHYYRSDLHLPYLLPDGAKPMENLTPPKNLPVTKSDFNRVFNVFLQNHYREVFNQKALDQFSEIFRTATKPLDTRISDLFYEICMPAKLQTQYCNDTFGPLSKAYTQFVDFKNPADREFLHMMYDSILKILDNEVGSFLNSYISSPGGRDTIVIIMSDHGEAFGEHNAIMHNPNFHSELFYTPLIIHVPGLPAKKINRTTSTMDIFPTILELAGLKPLTNLQGRSVIPYVKQPDFNPDSFMIGENYEMGTILQNRDWLYYLPIDATGSAGSILFNKRADPQETINVADKNPLLVQKLFNQVRIYNSYEPFANPLPFPTPNISPEKLQRLRTEGYF